MSHIMEALMSANEAMDEAKKDERNAQSVFDSVLIAIAEHKRLSGLQELNEALIRVTREAERNPEFQSCVREMAQHILRIFPVARDDEATSSHNS